MAQGSTKSSTPPSPRWQSTASFPTPRTRGSSLRRVIERMRSESEAPSPASIWLQHGQSLEASGRLDEAISFYDRALATNPSSPRLHALLWMNRGNALQKLASVRGDVDRQNLLVASVLAYDEAINRFAMLPLEDPEHRNHLGAAWLNHGHALLLLEHPEAAESFACAISHLEQLPLETGPHYRLNLAGAHTNLAHTLLVSDRSLARAHAEAALA